MRVAGIHLGCGNILDLSEKILELLFTGSDGSTVFTDTSGKNSTINRRNSTTIQGNRARFYNDDNLSASNADTTLFNLYGYDFKIEFDFEVIQIETNTIVYGNSTNGATSLHLKIESDSRLKLVKDGVILFDFGVPSLATNYNIKIIRTGPSIDFKVNNVSQTLLVPFTTANLNMSNYGGVYGSNQFGSTKQRLYMDNIVITRSPKTEQEPTGIMLFEGNQGATTTTNSGSVGTASFFNGAIISTAKSFEGNSSCYLTGGAFARYDPTVTDSNHNLSTREFYISVYFNPDTIDTQQRGLLFAESNGGGLIFRAYHENGIVKCVIRQANGTSYTVTVPNLTCTTNTWYKLELIRTAIVSNNPTFTVKVGNDSITQNLTNVLESTTAYVDIGAYWSGAKFIGHIDRFIYRVGSSTTY